MQFKIDTKANYTTITPVEEILTANMAGELTLLLGEAGQKINGNVIIDCGHLNSVQEGAAHELEKMHDTMYNAARSLVFTKVSAGVLTNLAQYHTDQKLNIVPSFEEAVDVISMEILERELMDEGDDEDDFFDDEDNLPYDDEEDDEAAQ